MRITILALLVLLPFGPVACNSEHRDNDGDGWTEYMGDCDDKNALINPDAPELCNNGISDDCDDGIDEGASCGGTWQLRTCTSYVYRDRDGDGYGDPLDPYCDSPDNPQGMNLVVKSNDCNDWDGDIHPNANELCNEIDDDCDGEIDEEATDAPEWYLDYDSDGYGDEEFMVLACDEPPEGYVDKIGDCEPMIPAINPGVNELCNEIDDDCDGEIDEDAVDGQDWYPDDDNDGFGDANSAATVACDAPDGYADNSDDCDDSKFEFSPEAEEVCDGLDNNCDGEIDEGQMSDPITWYLDGDGDGYGDLSKPLVACEKPLYHVDNGDDCNDGRNDINPSANELCDSVDNNCDGDDTAGAIDQDSWPVDADGDGFGHKIEIETGCIRPIDAPESADDCDDDNPLVYPGADEICNGYDDDCDNLADDADSDVTNQQIRWDDADGDGFGAGERIELCFPDESLVMNDDDCDDTNDAIFPGADEFCDGEDNNCDGVIDGDDALDVETWYADNDGDGHGNASITKLTCDAPTGYVDKDDDCDDTQDDVYPGAEELCNQVDNNCNELVDDDASDATVWYEDADQDGFGSRTEKVWECDKPTGYVDDSLEFDCNDANNAVYPDADEVCNGYDDDCDNLVDDADGNVLNQQTRWQDIDLDGFGAGEVIELCFPDESFVTNDNDCDDTRDDVYPGADEYCDGDDNNCDGVIDGDDAIDVETWYVDTDGDGHGNASFTKLTCDKPTGYVFIDNDCDDTRDYVYPGANEVCNNIDDDCNELVDDDASDASIWYLDNDEDGYGSPIDKVWECEQPFDYVDNNDDCNDNNDGVYPDAFEYCDGRDNDCDGIEDEDPACSSGLPVDTGDTGDTGSIDTGTLDTGDAAMAEFTIECLDSGGGYMDITVRGFPFENVDNILVYAWDGSVWNLVKDEPNADPYQVSTPLSNLFLMARLSDGRIIDVSLQDMASETPHLCAPEYNNSGDEYWFVWFEPVP